MLPVTLLFEHISEMAAGRVPTAPTFTCPLCGGTARIHVITETTDTVTLSVTCC
jgi:hypothetical protein